MVHCGILIWGGVGRECLGGRHVPDSLDDNAIRNGTDMLHEGYSPKISATSAVLVETLVRRRSIAVGFPFG